MSRLPASTTLAFGVIMICAAGCSSGRVATKSRPVLRPFVSDGCSLFPDGTIKEKEKWKKCCVEHDIAYWQGGTKQDRINADIKLRDDILAKTGNKGLAEMVYQAVRTWGGPAFPSWYRWGYGWPYGRGYSSLTKRERKQIRKRLREYYESRKREK
ncbi:hypothetical protein ACFLQU_04595 [Verrucomicrobiota bacterium]